MITVKSITSYRVTIVIIDTQLIYSYTIDYAIRKYLYAIAYKIYIL